MTVIRPNSISGVSSITGNGGDISIFRADGTAADVTVNNITSGVITATTFVGGTINAASATITGNLGVGGVLTYEDVANIDSVGIVTARLGINLVGNDLNVGSNIKIGNASGIITATSFRGDASQMTGAGLGTDGSANTSGIITATALVPTTGQLSHRNIIVNGDFKINQRGSSSTSSGYQTVDRFAMYFTGTDANPTQTIFGVSAPAQYHLPMTGPHPYKEGFRTAWGISNGNQTSGAGAADYIYMSHKIEAQEMAQCGWNYTDANSFITLSFWVKQGVNANLNTYGYLKVPDSSTAQHYAFETGTLAFATWKKVIVKIPGNSNLEFDTDSAANRIAMGLEIVWSPFFGTDYTSSGATLNTWGNLDNAARMPDYATTWYTTNNASFQITGVQLEVGPVATPFEHRSYKEELARCQRYFYKPLTSNGNIYAGRWGNNSTYVNVFYPTQMRDTPTIGGNARRTGGTSYIGKDYFSYTVGQDDNWWENFTATSEL
jgi:hypothetical protein